MIEFNAEIRNRIRLSVAAYAYEIENDPIMSDAEFDDLALSIDTRIETGNELLDEFFRTEFVTFSAMWVYQHPDLQGLKRLYEMLIENAEADARYNRDLFAPFLKVRVSPERDVKNACRRCGGDTMKFPAEGGCHC